MTSDDDEDFLRRWAADIRASSGQSVDADRLDAIADRLAGPKPISVGPCVRCGVELTVHSSREVLNEGTACWPKCKKAAG